MQRERSLAEEGATVSGLRTTAESGAEVPTRAEERTTVAAKEEAGQPGQKAEVRGRAAETQTSNVLNPTDQLLWPTPFVLAKRLRTAAA
jgi:hypothetical protein